MRNFTLCLCAIAVLFTLPACRTTPLLPVNLADPAWHIQRTPAVWRPHRRAPELAGEIIFAHTTNSQSFVQFSKNPFPLVTAQTDRQNWQLEISATAKTYRGQHTPPKSILWFAAPLTEISSPKFSLVVSNAQHWRLENKSTGETLEVFFTP